MRSPTSEDQWRGASHFGEAMNTWTNRELVVLRAIVEAEEAGADADTAAMSVGDFDYDERLRCIQRLHDGGYIEARFNGATTA